MRRVLGQASIHDMYYMCMCEVRTYIIAVDQILRWSHMVLLALSLIR